MPLIFPFVHVGLGVGWWCGERSDGLAAKVARKEGGNSLVRSEAGRAVFLAGCFLMKYLELLVMKGY